MSVSRLSRGWEYVGVNWVSKKQASKNPGPSFPKMQHDCVPISPYLPHITHIFQPPHRPVCSRGFVFTVFSPQVKYRVDVTSVVFLQTRQRKAVFRGWVVLILMCKKSLQLSNRSTCDITAHVVKDSQQLNGGFVIVRFIQFGVL